MKIIIKDLFFAITLILIGTVYLGYKRSLPVAEQVIFGILAWATCQTLLELMKKDIKRERLFTRVVHSLFPALFFAQVFWEGRVTIASAAILVLYGITLFIDKRIHE